MTLFQKTVGFAPSKKSTQVAPVSSTTSQIPQPSPLNLGPGIPGESPHHIVRTLEELGRELGDRRIALCRELTKKFEEIVRTTISGALDYFQEREPRGEYVVLIEGRSAEEIERENSRQWEGLSAAEHVAYYESRGADHKEAMKMAAKDRGVSKRDIYNELLKL